MVAAAEGVPALAGRAAFERAADPRGASVSVRRQARSDVRRATRRFGQLSGKPVDYRALGPRGTTLPRTAPSLSVDALSPAAPGAPAADGPVARRLGLPPDEQPRIVRHAW